MPAERKKDRKKDDGTPMIHVGVYMFPNGDKYEGDYLITEGGSLERCGKGTHTTAEGTVYEGQWVGDKMNGIGTLSHPSGATYHGEFVDNQFHGKGCYTWPNGSNYEGQFVENRLEGEGQFTDTVSQQWTGTFRYKAAPGLRFKLNMG
ncbi:uncharacterized protein LOC143277032 [Babylonia areolata]|uniref:uncharacterized protein LOC143277032 n=1 Tax=Babylonia areolata TaxID=304850 RepID=UPI003FD3ABDA